MGFLRMGERELLGSLGSVRVRIYHVTAVVDITDPAALISQKVF